MAYDSPVALRAALEQRLQSEAQATGIALNRLRRRVVFERIIFRIDAAEPGNVVGSEGLASALRARWNAATSAAAFAGPIPRLAASSSGRAWASRCRLP